MVADVRRHGLLAEGPEGSRSAYVFTRSAGVWSQVQKLTVADAAAGDQFGWSVAVSGNRAVLGGTWSRQRKLTAADPGVWDRCGFAVALSADTAMLGAPPHDKAADKPDVGSVFMEPMPPLRLTALSPKGTIRTARPTMAWRGAAEAASYEVRVYRGARLLLKKAGCTAASWKASKALPRHVYLTWKVRGRNAAGLGPWSSAPKFKIR